MKKLNLQTKTFNDFIKLSLITEMLIENDELY